MLNNQIIAIVQGAFMKKCIVLIGRAYGNLCSYGVVNRDMDENTVSENLRRLMSWDQFSSSNGILVTREQPIDNGCLLTSTQTADVLPRIDFQFQKSWSNMHTFVFFMEAKNLYANDFIKTDNRNKTSAKASHKRYVKKGISHILTGYYPSTTCMLGYVLEGTINDAVNGVNAQIASVLSPKEILTPSQTSYPTLSAYVSTHSQDRTIFHLMLQF